MWIEVLSTDFKKKGLFMNKLFIYFIVFIITISTLSSGCSSVRRTKFTDPVMRIAIDPTGIDANNYVRIQQALSETGKWIIVDRSLAFEAIIKEQQRQHRDMSDRFMDKEKYAIFGRLLGVGGIITAHNQCVLKKGFWKKDYPVCRQYIAIVSTTSGEVIATAEGQSEGGSYEYTLAPSWQDVADKLADNYPSHYEENKDHRILKDYKNLSAEEALRQKEIVAKDKIKNDQDIAH